MATPEERKRRVAAMYAAAGLAAPEPAAGPRMSITFGGGAPDPRVTGIRNRMDPDYEGQFSQEPGAYAKPTRIEVKGETARDYSNELGTRQQFREIAADTWKRTPLPVIDSRDLNDEKLIAENDRANRYGLSVDPLDARIAARARSRRNPRFVQAALERLSQEDVVTGGPGLDPGETMPAGAYSRMRQQETAAAVADKTGKVQYMSPGPGNVAEWMAPGKPVSTEIKGVGEGGKAVVVDLRPADKAAYDAAMAPLDREMRRIADKSAMGPHRTPEQIRADMQKVAEATIARSKETAGPIPASDMSSGAGVPGRDMQPGIEPMDRDNRGPEQYASWAAQAQQVTDLARKGMRRQAEDLARKLLGQADIPAWLPDRWSRTEAPRIIGTMREAMRTGSRIDPLAAFQNVANRLSWMVTGELPSGIKQERQAKRTEAQAQLAADREARVAGNQEQAVARQESEKKQAAAVKAMETELKDYSAEMTERMRERAEITKQIGTLATLPKLNDYQQQHLKDLNKWAADVDTRIQQLRTAGSEVRAKMKGQYQERAGGQPEPGKAPSGPMKPGQSVRVFAMPRDKTQLQKDGLYSLPDKRVGKWNGNGFEIQPDIKVK